MSSLSNVYGTIKIDGLSEEIPLLNDDSELSLYRGVGFMQGNNLKNALPSSNGQTIIDGHRELGLNGLSKIQNNNKPNNIITLYNIKDHKNYKYRMYEATIINDNEGHKIFKQNLNYNELVIYTCYPVDGNNLNPSKRLVIFAKLIE